MADEVVIGNEADLPDLAPYANNGAAIARAKTAQNFEIRVRRIRFSGAGLVGRG